MDGLWWKTLLKWMIWGYHYFWKHPKSGSNPSSSPRRSCPRSVNSAGSPSRSASGSGEAGASGGREELPAPLVTRFESSFPGGVRATTELSWRIHKGGFCFFVASHGRSHGKRVIEGNKNEMDICGNSKCCFCLICIYYYIHSDMFDNYPLLSSKRFLGGFFGGWFFCGKLMGGISTFQT